MKRSHTFEHNGLTITVHCRTGADELDGDTVATHLYLQIGGALSPALNNRLNAVTRIITQTDSVEGDLGFTLPNAMASADDLYAAYLALMERDDGLVRKWVRELDMADSPPSASPADRAAADPKGPAPTSTTGLSASTPAVKSASSIR